MVDDQFGFETARLFFDSSETLVVTDGTVEAQLRAASIAVVAHAPMLVDDDLHDEVVAEISRLGVHTILTVGDVSLAPSSGAVSVVRDPGGLEALGVMTALLFSERTLTDPAGAAAVVAELTAEDPTWLRAAWADPVVLPRANATPFPVQSRRDADMAPVVVGTRDSSIAAVANARSFGASVKVVDNPDPSASQDTLRAMAGLGSAPLVALGGDFGTDALLAARIMHAEEIY
ncbi:hypothetical protein CAPI_06265 [Corynebacterium capitovis DSM 44611]|uniref:hypothetical protein n=1 Tax=Corynebacterium capitovis TaxID=131081 RepID=UPI0003A5E4F2|nr:hypothetical protein [Corynebacterium capitovis]WKD57794.1 hypothetical protein CAPI_06265 [Corynebacterium capitovis DSM 44611]